ncbi:uncharacterized protein [Malus domestica]|uniref:uncharacterized protein n=1 Tax=Malus domestica TaxID=3750 RepID=UPI0039771DA1
MEHGYFLLFGGTVVEIYDDKSLSNLVTKVEVKNRSFPLVLKYLEEVARKASVTGSMNYGTRGCAFGKHRKDPFEVGKAWRATKPLELIHTDVCVWVYFMRFKSEVFTIFKKFKTMVELQSGYQIKRLRSDREFEYTSHEFNAFCEDVGLEKQLTVAYSPQQNGIAERKNKTIIEMAKSMMHEKNMSYTFWGEAVNTSVYLLNRCPTKALDKKTLFEVFSVRKPFVKHLKVFGSVCYTLIKPFVKHLRVFGSVCYTLIPHQLRHKLEKSSNKDVFVGYGTSEKGYIVYNVLTQKIILLRDVIFDEDSMWNWETRKNPSEATLYTKTESNNKTLIVSIYMDDVVYTRNDAAMIEEFKEEMMKRKYAETLLEKFGLKGCKPVSTPLIANEKLKKDNESEFADASLYKSIVGSLLYLTITRPNLMFSASLLFRFMQNPSKIHMGTAKRVLRYVQGTLDYGIKYEMGKLTILIGFCDNGWGGSEDDSRNTSGYAFTFGS